MSKSFIQYHNAKTQSIANSLLKAWNKTATYLGGQ